MPAKKILTWIFLIFGFLALFIIFKYRTSLNEKLYFNLEKAKAHKDNFFFAASPHLKRKKPISFLERETELKLYIGEPFNNFNEKDWQEFWDIIYQARPIEAPAKEGLPKKMRQLTEDEIAFELVDLYPQPFASFREKHWKVFFGIILKK